MKTGFVAIVGKPNVGKSTFLNNLLGTKVSIVSPRPATTRIKVLGIYNTEDAQIIFIDTPGFEKARNELGKFMLGTIFSSFEDADLIFFIIEADGWTEEDEKILETLKKTGKKIILGINKVDLIKEKEFLLPLIEESSKKHDFAEIVPFSALKNKNIQSVIKAITSHLPEGERLFPEDTITNLPLKYRIEEIIREKVLQKTYQEVPHSVAVEVEEMKPGDKNKEVEVIKANIIVDRDNLKSIIIGKKGSKIKQIGKLAREEIELLLEKKVYLDLNVKTIENWREKPDIFRRFGYGSL
ncbi:MAG TPA: GTPase Era [Firmicutes bacterium]|nr:GTPase Era [Bacillota bacterium]